MPRVSKHPEVRREELLDVALDLCRRVGFDAMSVDQLTTQAGVAKGTFYHYFSSKSDLLWQLVQRFGDSLFAALTDHLATVEGDGLVRLRALMDASAAYKAAHLDALSYAPFLYREENLALRHRLFDAWLARTREVLLPVIEAGSADGSFDVDDPEGATDVVLTLWVDAADRLWRRAIRATDAEAFADTMLRGTAALWAAQERVLGVPDGSFAITIAPAAIAGMKDLYTRLDRNGS